MDMHHLQTGSTHEYAPDFSYADFPNVANLGSSSLQNDGGDGVPPLPDFAAAGIDPPTR